MDEDENENFIGLSSRKIILPEEFINENNESAESESESESESENDEDRESEFRLLNRYLIIDPQIFRKEITSSIVCKHCHSEVNLLENPVFHHGLGTK